MRSTRRSSVIGMFARTLAGAFVLLTVGGCASAQDMYFNRFSSRTDILVNGVAVLDVTRNIDEVPPVAAVRRSAAITSGTPAFSAERRGSFRRCAPENCVSTQDELVGALSAIVAEGGVGVITLCRDEPLVLSEQIILGGSIFKDVTIECCDVQRRRNSSSQPKCSIVTDTSPGSRCLTCGIVFEANSLESVELRGILFDGTGEGNTISLFGVVSYLFMEPMGLIMRRFSVVDCVFQNVKGVGNAVGPNLVAYQTRALNIFGVLESAPGEESVSIEIVRSGFFDNPTGGVGVVGITNDGSNGGLNVVVRDSQFERNGQIIPVFRIDDNSGLAVLGRFASVLVESSRFIDNLSTIQGAGIQIGTNLQTFGPPITSNKTDSASVTLRDNVFRGNRVPSQIATSGGAVIVRLSDVDNGRLIIDDSDFANNTARAGGGLVISGVDGDVSISKCRFRDNSGAFAAAIAMADVTSVAITRSKFDKNVGRDGDRDTEVVAIANLIGRSPFFEEGALVVSRSTFRKNTGTPGPQGP